MARTHVLNNAPAALQTPPLPTRPEGSEPEEHTRPGWRRGQELRAHLQANEAVRRCGLAYDPGMQRHRGPDGHPEQPGRIIEVWRQLGDAGLTESCSRVRSRHASKRELLYVHSARHVDRVLRTAPLCARQYNAGKQIAQGGGCHRPAKQDDSIKMDDDTYMCDETPDSARLAAGCVLSLVDAIMDTDSPVSCGMAIVRPPGHHASSDRASGFCFFNNVAIAVRHLQKVHGFRKILIVDWDVHHGDGTSEIFAEDSDVLVFDVHRSDPRGAFFPGSGFLEDAGKGSAKGFTVNVPLNKGYADLDLCHVIRHVLFPAAERFQPEFILISSGFDAVHDDYLGGCHMTPQGFGWATRSVHLLAQRFCAGRLALVLEGGYNCENIGRCVVESVGALALEVAGAAPMVNSLPPLPQLHASGSSQAWMWTHAPASSTVNTVRKLTELHHLYELQLPVAPRRADGFGKGPPTGKNSKKISPNKVEMRPTRYEDDQSDNLVASEPEMEPEVQSEDESIEAAPVPPKRNQRTAKWTKDWRIWTGTLLFLAILWKRFEQQSSFSNRAQNSAATKLADQRLSGLGEFSWESVGPDSSRISQHPGRWSQTRSVTEHAAQYASRHDVQQVAGIKSDQKETAAHAGITASKTNHQKKKLPSSQKDKAMAGQVTDEESAKKKVSRKQKASKIDNDDDIKKKKAPADIARRGGEPRKPERSKKHHEKQSLGASERSTRDGVPAADLQGDKKKGKKNRHTPSTTSNSRSMEKVKQNKEKRKSKDSPTIAAAEQRLDTKTKSEVNKAGFYVQYGLTHPRDISIYIPIARSLKSKEVKVKISSKHVQVNLGAGKPIIDKLLPDRVVLDVSESFWEIGTHQGKRCVRMTLRSQVVLDQVLPLLSADPSFKPVVFG